MNQFRLIASVVVLAAAACAGAAMGQAVNLDGSVHRAQGPTLASAAAGQLRHDDVPSVKTDPARIDASTDAKAAADADLKKRHLHVKARRENLKGDDAKRAIAQRQDPSTYDRTIQNGDIDHTEQVTDLKVTVKK